MCVEREMDINRGNKKLLEKLVEISKGKHLSVEPLNSGQVTNHQTSTASALVSFRPKSLNLVLRKKEI
jgi:Hemingway/CFA97